MNDPTENSQPIQWLTWALVAMIVALGVGLRWHFATADRLWLDELHTSWAVKGSLADVAPRALAGNQNQLFFWATWLASQLLETSEFQVRFFAWLSGVATVLVIGWMAWRLTDAVTSVLVAVSAVSLGSEFVFYGSEARPYATVHLLSLCQVVVFWYAIGLWPSRLQKGPLEITTTPPTDKANRLLFKTMWLALGLSLVSAALLYVHMTSAWLLFAEFLYVVGRLIARRSDSLLKFSLATTLLTGLLLLPLVQQFLFVFQRRGNWDSLSSPANIWGNAWPLLICFVMVPWVVQAIARAWSNRSTNHDAAWSEKNSQNSGRMLFCLLWAGCSLGSVCLLDWIDVPIALPRYTQVGSVALPLFAALAIAKISSNRQRAWAASLVLILFIGFCSVVDLRQPIGTLPTFRFEDWSSVISEINADSKKSHQPIYLFANLIEDVDAVENREEDFQEYLTFPLKGIYSLAPPSRTVMARPTLAAEHFTEQDISRALQSNGCWIVVRGDLNLATEIADEVRVRAASRGKAGTRVSIFQLAPSPVVLLRVDW